MQSEEELTYAVIGKAMEVHRELGPGLDETFYHRALSDKLATNGLEHQFKPKGRLMHRGVLADEFEADLMVPQRLIVEAKALGGPLVLEHYVQIICYLKFWRVRTGLLFDFGKESLVTKRVLQDPQSPTALNMAEPPSFVADAGLLEVIWSCMRRVYDTHGLGYRDTTYRGLVVADLAADKISYRDQPEVQIRGLGQAWLHCLVVHDACALMVVALRENIRAADRSILQTYLKYLGLPWGLIVNFGKQKLTYEYVIHPRQIRGRPESVG